MRGQGVKDIYFQSMNKSKILVGIDPDVVKSGVALLDTYSQSFLALSDYRLFELFVKLGEWHEKYDIFVYLEAGHMVKQYWQKKGHGVAKSVGANNEIGRQIQVFMDENHIPYQLLKPSGYSNYDHETFCNITGWPKSSRTNPEKRAAGMMVYGKKNK